MTIEDRIRMISRSLPVGMQREARELGAESMEEVAEAAIATGIAAGFELPEDQYKAYVFAQDVGSIWDESRRITAIMSGEYAREEF